MGHHTLMVQDITSSPPLGETRLTGHRIILMRDFLSPPLGGTCTAGHRTILVRDISSLPQAIMPTGQTGSLKNPFWGCPSPPLEAHFSREGGRGKKLLGLEPKCYKFMS